MAPVGKRRRKKLQDLRSENSQVSFLGNKENIDFGLNLTEDAHDQANEAGFGENKEIKCEIVEECEKKSDWMQKRIVKMLRIWVVLKKVVARHKLMQEAWNKFNSEEQ
ncbi:hypothetical protein GH714_004159 [Hevea brasiliensis]|uniref:Uncharacterized protein n=1 Tax=Hevea brasiliensis TaxID=3981 RepID=A0A6A6KMP0_HEVBR|nr:hypothetical protein GH714_004159 [Hevea brasiliensis]